MILSDNVINQTKLILREKSLDDLRKEIYDNLPFVMVMEEINHSGFLNTYEVDLSNIEPDTFFTELSKCLDIDFYDNLRRNIDFQGSLPEFQFYLNFISSANYIDSFSVIKEKILSSLPSLLKYYNYCEGIGYDEIIEVPIQFLGNSNVNQLINFLSSTKNFFRGEQNDLGQFVYHYNSLAKYLSTEVLSDYSFAMQLLAFDPLSFIYLENNLRENSEILFFALNKLIEKRKDFVPFEDESEFISSLNYFDGELIIKSVPKQLLNQHNLITEITSLGFEINNNDVIDEDDDLPF